MFAKKKTSLYMVPYDPVKQRAILKCSICNGEQVAGFKDKETGHFTEVVCIKDEKDLEEFMEYYGLASITKEY